MQIIFFYLHKTPTQHICQFKLIKFKKKFLPVSDNHNTSGSNLASCSRLLKEFPIENPNLVENYQSNDNYIHKNEIQITEPTKMEIEETNNISVECKNNQNESGELKN